MIKITLEELVNSQNILQKLITEKFPISTSYAISRIIKKVNIELKEFYDAQSEMAEKYGERNELGTLLTDLKTGNTPVKEEYKEQFQKEMTDLLKIEVILEVNPINIEQLSNINVSAQELFWLDKFLITE